MDEAKLKKPPSRRSAKSLRLDLDAAKRGETWLLLPEGFRTPKWGREYPLPTMGPSLESVARIQIPADKADAGCIYIKRARKRQQAKEKRRASAVDDIRFRKHKVEEGEKAFTKKMEKLEIEAKRAVEGVKREAEKATASLKTLFDLGKQGLEQQMRAHIDGEEWQDEKISAAAFRDCYGKISKTVKDFGLPADPKDMASETMWEEFAKSVKETRDTAGMAPGNDETEQ